MWDKFYGSWLLSWKYLLHEHIFLNHLIYHFSHSLKFDGSGEFTGHATWRLNSPRPSDAHMLQQAMLSLIQIMGPWERNNYQWIWIKIQSVSFKKTMWKCRLQNGGHFLSLNVLINNGPVYTRKVKSDRQQSRSFNQNQPGLYMQIYLIFWSDWLYSRSLSICLVLYQIHHSFNRRYC